MTFGSSEMPTAASSVTLRFRKMPT
jgi:hypothetical protein